MAYTAQKLITKSWFLSGIVGRGLQTVTGDQVSDGLDLLNLLISTKAYDKGFIPYFTQYSLNAVVGTELYFIPNLVEIETLTYNIGVIRFPTVEAGRKNYFGTPRADNINSLPFKFHSERVKGGMNVYLYFLPADTYPIKIWGKFAFSDITLITDLLSVYDEYYINYLKYELAAYMCNDYNIPVQPQVASTLEQMRNKMRDQSPPDLTTTKRSRFNIGGGTMWGWANLGKGWTVPG